ncbi:phospholipase A2-alpha isoform X1 [Rosa chinensis]|uniref:phospholipase A2-alpha isoform X1 n=1 Tax=Rosa chinensis TaxID=74649 RepID=UPI001AD8D782|nr:phospholipase A2-alpha isoform X1 [Rosa chinensis]
MAIARRFDTIMALRMGVYNVMLIGFAMAWLSCVVDGASRRHVFEVGSRGRLPDHSTIRTVLEVATSKGEIKPLNETEAAQSKDCSRKCESEFCTVPPLLRYGKYCGLLYSGCPGEKPCDGLDSCCMQHDACVQSKNNDYLSSECSQNFLKCMSQFKNAKGRTFKGSKCKVEDVVEVITIVMEAALFAGRYLHKP